VLLNHAKKEVKFKLVYHGPALAGKTTNVVKIAERRGKEVLSFETKEERTLVFDMVKEERRIGDFKATFILYTVPGQHIYSEIRKTVMRGADGVVFVADSSSKRLKEDAEFLEVLKEDLKLYGKNYEDTPVVLQYNKRDLPDAAPIEEMERLLNKEGKPSLPAVALKGEGVEETLNLLVEEVLKKFGSLLG